MPVSSLLISLSAFIALMSSCQSSTNQSQSASKNSSQNSITNNFDDISLANNYAKDGLLREAINEYKKVLDKKPNHFTARRNMGLVLVKIGDYKQAVTALEKIIKHFSQDFDTCFYYAEALRGKRNYADAIFWYNNALRINSKDPKVLKALAWSYFSIKYYSEALKTAKDLYNLDENDPQSVIIVARTFVKLDRPKDAFKILKKIKKQIKSNHPLYANILSLEGDINYDLGKADKAKASYIESVKIQPLLASALFGLGRCFLDENDYDNAISHFERAIRIKPRDHLSFYYIAKAYEKVDYKKSIKYYQLFKKRAATDPEYLSLIKEVKIKLGANKKNENNKSL